MSDNNINEKITNSEKGLDKALASEANSNLASQKSLLSISRTPYEFKEEPIQLVISSEDI